MSTLTLQAVAFQGCGGGSIVGFFNYRNGFVPTVSDWMHAALVVAVGDAVVGALCMIVPVRANLGSRELFKKVI